ncbi:hypothetical protein BDV93DRAFT_513451 [Ceratobasidium sp. AG-I]|nr:hypothetical protein BDV93DRAFT_513451 [Ceratobasidium sp. AG-I]
MSESLPLSHTASSYDSNSNVNEAKGTVRAESEYVQEELSEEDEASPEKSVTRPIIAGLAAAVSAESGLNSEGVRRNPARARIAPKRYDPEIPGIDVSGSKTKRRDVRGGKAAGPSRPRETTPVIETEGPSAMRDGVIGPTLGVEPEGEIAGTSRDQSSPQKETAPVDRSNALHLTEMITEIDALSSIRKGYEGDSQFGDIFSDPMVEEHGKGRRGFLRLLHIVRVVKDTHATSIWPPKAITRTPVSLVANWD